MSGSMVHITGTKEHKDRPTMSLPAKRCNLAASRNPDGIRGGSRRMTLRATGAASLAVALCLCASIVAEARPARCFTSDDGFYECDFVGSPQGGFTISASCRPTRILNID